MRELAIIPPFFTASVSNAKAHVDPGPPQCSIPMSSMIFATLSPTAGVGASDRSIEPKSTFILLATSSPINSPALTILKETRFMVSHSSMKFPSVFSTAALTTPGPLIPTLIDASEFPMPW